MSKTIIWGHRGAGFRGVENSMSSFKKAVDMGVDGIKTEAQLLNDGEIVLKFLPFVIIEGNKLLLKDLNLEDIKHLRLGNNESILILHNLFDEFKDRIRYNFDIFGVETGLKIIDIAEEYGLLDNIEITKPVAHTKAAETLFEPLRKRYKDIKLVCSLFSDTQISQENYKLLDKMEKLHIQVLNLNHHRFNLEVFKRVKRAGFKFYLWGVLFKYFMRKYLTLSYKGKIVDGIYTNYPDKLINLRNSIVVSE
jgi:glycerophosphoryl diester phosphodiesterase